VGGRRQRPLGGRNIMQRVFKKSSRQELYRRCVCLRGGACVWCVCLCVCVWCAYSTERVRVHDYTLYIGALCVSVSFCVSVFLCECVRVCVSVCMYSIQQIPDIFSVGFDMSMSFCNFILLHFCRSRVTINCICICICICICNCRAFIA